MGEFLQLAELPQPRRVSELTPEAHGFKTFKKAHSKTESSRVVQLAFCPTIPHRLAVVSGTKVQFWQKGKAGEFEATSKVSKFKDMTQCVSWRNDGKLLLVGEASGSCAVIEADTRNVLRRFRGHGDAVTCAAFANADRSRAATGSKDGKLRLWDITTDQMLMEVPAHSDCMKSLDAGPGGPDGWISAGYDGHIKVWDLRMAAAGSDPKKTGADAKACCAASMDHGHQVEAGVVFPSGTMYASAGGPAVKLWDIAMGGRPVQAMDDCHSKAVTAVCLDATASSLLTASFDGLAKVFHAASLEHLWTYKLPGPATCAAWRPDGNAFAVGLDDGQWQLRERKPAAQSGKDVSEAAKAKKPVRTSKGRMRGRDAEAASDDEVVDFGQKKKRKKISAIDFFLKKFEYRKVCEYMIDINTPARDSLAVVDELLQRGALRAALRNLPQELCLAALQWVQRRFGSGDTLQEHLLFEALHTLIDSNRCLQPPSTPELTKVVADIEMKVNAEMRMQEALFETSGMLEMVMNL